MSPAGYCGRAASWGLSWGRAVAGPGPGRASPPSQETPIPFGLSGTRAPPTIGEQRSSSGVEPALPWPTGHLAVERQASSPHSAKSLWFSPPTPNDSASPQDEVTATSGASGNGWIEACGVVFMNPCSPPWCVSLHQAHEELRAAATGADHRRAKQVAQLPYDVDDLGLHLDRLLVETNHRVPHRCDHHDSDSSGRSSSGVRSPRPILDVKAPARWPISGSRYRSARTRLYRCVPKARLGSHR